MKYHNVSVFITIIFISGCSSIELGSGNHNTHCAYRVNKRLILIHRVDGIKLGIILNLLLVGENENGLKFFQLKMDPVFNTGSHSPSALIFFLEIPDNKIGTYE